MNLNFHRRGEGVKPSLSFITMNLLRNINVSNETKMHFTNGIIVV